MMLDDAVMLVHAFLQRDPITVLVSWVQRRSVEHHTALPALATGLA
jgi:hypothetical protein